MQGNGRGGDEGYPLINFWDFGSLVKFLGIFVIFVKIAYKRNVSLNARLGVATLDYPQS
jgi:hypothetical protein